MKKVLLRYLVVVCLFMAALLLCTFYYRALYTGPVSTSLPKYPEDASQWFWFLFAASVLFGLKYFLYELLVLVVARFRQMTEVTTMLFYVGYAIALAGDLFLLYASMAPQVDAGFVLLGIIFWTPPALLVAAVVVALASKRKVASR
jgi:hypothetical protein